MMAGLPKEMIKMIKRIDLKLLSMFCMIALASLLIVNFAFSANKEMVQEWISAEDGGSVTLEDVTIEFEGGVLSKDTKIHIIYFGDGEYQFGPEIKVDGTFTLFFADAPAGESIVLTFQQGEWIELICFI